MRCLYCDSEMTLKDEYNQKVKTDDDYEFIIMTILFYQCDKCSANGEQRRNFEGRLYESKWNR